MNIKYQIKRKNIKTKYIFEKVKDKITNIKNGKNNNKRKLLIIYTYFWKKTVESCHNHCGKAACIKQY